MNIIFSCLSFAYFFFDIRFQHPVRRYCGIHSHFINIFRSGPCQNAKRAFCTIWSTCWGMDKIVWIFVNFACRKYAHKVFMFVLLSRKIRYIHFLLYQNAIIIRLRIFSICYLISFYFRNTTNSELKSWVTVIIVLAERMLNVPIMLFSVFTWDYPWSKQSSKWNHN